MPHVSVSRRILVPCALVGAAVLGACEDKRVKEVDSGISRDSTMTIIAHDLPPSAKSDSFPNVYIRERYLMASPDEYVDAMRRGLKLAAARGVTAVHDKDGWLGALRFWQRLDEEGSLCLRVWQSIPQRVTRGFSER